MPDYENIRNCILDKLQVAASLVVKNKHGQSPQVLAGDLVLYTLSSKTRDTLAYMLGVSTSTLAKQLPKMFNKLLPKSLIHTKGTSWRFYLLKLVELKECTCCIEVLPTSMFWDKEPSCITCCNKSRDSSRFREEKRNYMREYYASNAEYRESCKMRTKTRKKRTKTATPPWSELLEIYDLYLNCPKGYHVDHVIPLNHSLVCGLHVLGNLQYLPAEENLTKSNKFEVV